MKKRILNLILLFLFAGTLCLQASINELQSAKISIEANNETLKNVFSQIEKKSGYAIVYEKSVVDPSKKISINAKNESVDKILDIVLAQSGNEYTFINSQIVITKAETKKVSKPQQSTKNLTGSVIDENRDPVIGASVTIPNTNIGTVTDFNGRFQLSIPEEYNTIQITYLGYKNQIINISDKNTISTQLVLENQGLDEIVVIGYGTIKKRDLTGSVASVKTKDIVSVPTSNAMEAIQGKVAGIDIVRTSGEAGAKPDILIRGNRSINGENKPLFIIDGIQGGNYEDLNPNDIATMDILKDASSTAIYGSQGSNGVVIITTKKGDAGKTTVTYDGYFGANTNVQYPNPLRGEAFMNYRREAYRTIGSWNSPADDVNAFTSDELQAIQDNKWVNWIDLVTRTGTHQSHNVSIQGGNEKARTFISLGYYQEQGIFPNDEAQRYNARSNVDLNVSKYVKAGLYTQLAYWDKDQINKLLLNRAGIAFPLSTPYDEAGNIVLHPMVGRADAYSPLADYVPNKAQKNNKQLNAMASAYLEINPFKGLSFRSNLGASINFSRTGSYYGQNSLAQTTNPSNGSIKNNNNTFITWDNILSYKNTFEEAHTIGITALTSWTEYKKEESEASNQDQKEDSFLWYNLGSGSATLNKVSSSYEDKKTLSYAFRIEYNFLNKYLVSGSFRSDGTGRLAKGSYWQSFPSISGAWIITEESFMQNMNWADFLKLRASWGVSGNAQVDYKASKTGIESSNSWGFGEIPAPTYKYSQNVGNDKLTWEKSKTYDIGIDYSIFKDRLNFSIDYYHTKTSNILMRRDMPTALYGVGAVMWQNIASTENKGLEITLNTVNVKTKDFEWSSTITFSKDKEKITSLIDGRNIIGKNDTDYSLLIGKPIKSWWDLKKLGIWQLDEMEEMEKYSYYGSTPKPGDIKVYDANGDYELQDNDEVYVGSNTPKWVGGFQNTFRFKGFDLSVYMFARWGQTIAAKYMYGYNPAGAVSSGNGMQQANTFDTFDYWTPENPTNDFPRPEAGSILPTTARSLYFVDGSFFKIKTLTLGYTFPKEWMNKVGINNLRIYGTANNLLTEAKSHLLLNYDPEGNGGDEMPLFKTFVGGISISF